MFETSSRNSLTVYDSEFNVVKNVCGLAARALKLCRIEVRIEASFCKGYPGRITTERIILISMSWKGADISSLQNIN